MSGHIRAADLKICALTMVRDEAVMLPRWLAHYGAQCGPRNLVVVDDNTTDGSTDGLDCSVVRVPDWGDRHFETTRMTLLSGLAAGLLAAYDVVLLADADEFLVADPRRYPGLRDLFADRDAPVLGAINLNVVHDAAREPALDPTRPVLGQRALAKHVPLMCKPMVKRVPAPWVASSHGTTVPYEVDPDLYMFHLKFAERDHLRSVGDHRKALADAEGRASQTSWQFGGNDLVDLLDEVTAGLDRDRIPEFAPRPRALGRIVRVTGRGIYRAHGRRQVRAMRDQPMVRVPERFHGLV